MSKHTIELMMRIINSFSVAFSFRCVDPCCVAASSAVDCKQLHMCAVSSPCHGTALHLTSIRFSSSHLIADDLPMHLNDGFSEL